MDRLKTLAILLKVAETGSFSKCAEELNLGQPAVSKAIDSLEKDLGTKVFLRSTRRLSFTEDGRRLLAEARKVIDSYDEFVAASQLKSVPKGLVRVTCPNALGTLYLIPALRKFMRMHPQIAIQLRITDSYLDIFENDIDVALRVGDLEPSPLVAKYLGQIPRIAVASESYLNENGIPLSISDLDQHGCVAVSRSGSTAIWEGTNADGKAFASEIKGRVVVDNHLALRAAVESGLGIGLAGKFLFSDKNGLRRGLRPILKKVDFKSFPVHLVFKESRTLPARVRLFVDHIFEDLRKQDWIES